MASPATEPPLSLEEHDALERSTHRIKTPSAPSPLDPSSASPNHSLLHPESIIADNNTDQSATKSFRDTLVSGSVLQEHPIVTYEELEAINQQMEVVEEGVQSHGPKIPSVRLTPEITMKLRNNWKNTFSSMDDRHRILTGGPWKIFDHYQAVQPWQPNFRPSYAKAPKTAIWVHFPELPTEYYEEPILRLLGNKVGRTIYVDKTTLLAVRGQYAKVCVEVDLAQPLASMVDFNDGIEPENMILTVAYDLNNVCFHCGEFGHKKDACHYKQRPAAAESTSQAAEGNPRPTQTLPLNCATLAEPYGPWTIVSRKSRRPPNRINQKKLVESSENSRGNRFAMISNLETESPELEELPAVAGKSTQLKTGRVVGDLITADPGVYDGNYSAGPKAIQLSQTSLATVLSKVVRDSPLSTPCMTSASLPIAQDTEINSGLIVQGTQIIPDCSVLRSIPVSSVDTSHSGSQALDAQVAAWVNHSPFRRECKEMLRSQQPDIVCFLETKADSSSRAMKFMPKFGFDSQFQIPTAGLAGGLWLFWKSSTVKLSVFSSSTQAIHCTVNHGVGDWILSLAYVRPQSHYKEAFWNDVEFRSASITNSWVIMGDLNDVMTSDEVFPRGTSVFNRASRFRHTLDRCNLLSQDSLGCKYTWCRTQNGRVILRERLDRALFNMEAKQRFLGAKLFTLPRTCSDHHPILLCLDTAAAQVPTTKPQRFEAAWLTRDGFERVFSQAWEGHSSDLKDAINATSKTCLQWGKETFGNIFRKKRLLRARLAGIQNSPAYGRSSNLQNLEKLLLLEYQQVLFEEELLWFQKSRIDWISSGDRNTSFYHMSTIMRRSRNKIGALKIDGSWTNHADTLKQHVRDFFMQLFTRRDTQPAALDTSRWQLRIADSDHQLLTRPATEDEVRSALFSMKGLKSPGPDGIQAIFYQRQWDTVKGTFVDFVNKALSVGSFDSDLTRALVVLIPKEDNPDVIQKFRPISLLNVAYKVLSKVIVARLRPFLQQLIGPYQSCFLAGRSTVDNIVLIQEVVHSMQRMKGSQGAILNAFYSGSREGKEARDRAYLSQAEKEIAMTGLKLSPQANLQWIRGNGPSPLSFSFLQKLD
ncbi:hypothetical protein SLEP1_g58858, partial [Rubroshorea leprosula]